MSVEWMRLHLTICDEEIGLYTSSQHRQQHCSYSLSPESTPFVEYCTGVSKKAPPPYQALSLLSFLSCVNFIDTAPSLHVPFISVLYTDPLSLTSDGSLLLLSCGPLSGN